MARKDRPQQDMNSDMQQTQHTSKNIGSTQNMNTNQPKKSTAKGK